MKNLFFSLATMFLISSPAFADKASCKASCGDSYRSAISSSKSSGDSCRSCCSSAGTKYGREHTICVNKCTSTQNAEYDRIHKDSYACHDRCN